MSVIEKQYWTEGIKEGQKLEQERIIKLIEQESEIDGFEVEPKIEILLTDLIALIKGETNEL